MKKYLFVMFIVSIFLLVACEQPQQQMQITGPEIQPAGNEEAAAQNPYITVSTQEIEEGLANVGKAYLDKPGYIVMHKVVNGQPADVIGYSDLMQEGEYSNTPVEIRNFQNEKELIAMLHYDDGDGMYKFPQDEDNPVMSNGQVVQMKFSLKKTEAEEKPETATVGAGSVEIEVIAKNWEFEPSTIKVKEGAKVKLTVKSIDIAHGIAIPDFGVSQRFEAGETVTVEFTADKKGAFSFFCNVYCGSGHRSMKGTLIVE